VGFILEGGKEGKETKAGQGMRGGKFAGRNLKKR